MADLTVSVLGRSDSPARTVVQARSFQLVIDEPPALGGDDHGPNPVEYVLAGFAGCLNVVSHLVARELGFEIRNLEISVTGPINPDRLFGKATGDRAGFKGIEVSIALDADIDEETKDRWLEIVESRCPVSDNLSQATPVRLALQTPVLT